MEILKSLGCASRTESSRAPCGRSIVDIVKIATEWSGGWSTARS